jgi:ABC-type multidrug transport system fused ATPase/permease subunit
MDYDKVAVFEGGKVVEFDSPQDRLWTKTVTDNGWFQLWKYDMRNSAVCQ